MDNDKGKEKDKHKHKKEICEYLQHTPAQYAGLKKAKMGWSLIPIVFYMSYGI